MLEAEIKLRLDTRSHASLEARLRELGARPGPLCRQVDVYFAHPGRDFARSDEALRLREDPSGLRITYKGAKLDPPRKTREEIEFALSTDRKTATRLLERLGFRPVGTVEKRRREFELRGRPSGTVSLDVVRGLGRFCEIEVHETSVARGRRRLADLARHLGLTALAPIADSYLELLQARSQRRKAG